MRYIGLAHTFFTDIWHALIQFLVMSCDNMLLMRSTCKCAFVSLLYSFVYSFIFPLNFCTRWQMATKLLPFFDSNVRIQYALAMIYWLLFGTEKKKTFSVLAIAIRVMNFLINAHRVALHGMYLSLLNVIKFVQQNNSI